MAGRALMASEPPITDSIRVSAAVLLKGETAPAPFFSGDWAKALSKGMPTSIALYLKPSSVIDSRNLAVKKAAAQALKLLGPAAPKAALDDPRLLADCARGWVELNLGEPGEDFEPRPYSTDTRTLLPKASRLVALGQADEAGRVRVRIALLRAMGVPARAAWLRGRPALQYWAQWMRDESETPGPAKKSKAAKGQARPKGEWVLDEASFAGETPEAWSLDAGDLAPAAWLPEQELALQGSLERAYFGLSETAAAMQALEAVRRDGALPGALRARSLPPRKGPWLMLANHRCRFYTEGSMEALSALELLLPYRPKLAAWGTQLPPRPESLETLATAFWSDRPDRVRLKKNGDWTDEYQSPPPAYGVLHYASFSLRKPASVLDAHLEGRTLVGKLLRRDSLAPRADCEITVQPLGLSRTALAARTGAEGAFRVELAPEDLKSPWIKVSGGQGSPDLSRWDSLLLEGLPKGQNTDF
jgi:hypothetical protein